MAVKRQGAKCTSKHGGSGQREGCSMSMIKVENLTFSYPSGYENIFENVNFKIDTDWKLGFIGRNGR